MTGVRIDRWLWAARFFKTRSLAAKACDLGRILSNAKLAKAAREVRVGDVLQVKNAGGEYEVEVLLLSETRGPAEWFTDVFAFAREAGLHLTAHAGESAGPESIRAALKLGAERIGHGIAAARDEALMRHLRERGIPLEICITSNLVTGVVKSIDEHPVRRLFDAGVPIVLNTDDPAMFGCTLVGEYRLAAERFGFSEAELRGIAENGFRYGWRENAEFAAAARDPLA